jgi:hypothetical protein
VIDQDGHYSLESDYGKLFSHPLDDYSNEESREIILACVYGMPANSGTNGRYGNRLPYFLTPNLQVPRGEFLILLGNIQVKVMGILFRLLILATMFLLTNKLILVSKIILFGISYIIKGWF